MKKIFYTSRWAGSSFWFPEKLILDNNSLTYIKKNPLSSKEIHIPYEQIASFKIEAGIFYANIFIETSGGENLIIKGIPKKDAKIINEIIKSKINN